MNIQLLNRQITGIIVGLLIVRFLGVPIASKLADAPSTETTQTDTNEVTQESQALQSAFDTLELQAAAAYVYDIRAHRALLVHNENAQLPLASLTKLMTALVALETFDEHDIIAVSQESLAQEGDIGLLAGERLTIRDLIDLTLVASSNDGAYALASALVALPGTTQTRVEDIPSKMNVRASELGLHQTYFANPTGLDIHEAVVGGAYGSARDVATMLSYIIERHPELLEATRDDHVTVTSLNGFEHEVANTNILVNDIPWLLGSKTGFTDLAGGNLAVVFDAGLARPVIAVVLGSTKEERFEDISRIVSTTFSHLATQ